MSTAVLDSPETELREGTRSDQSVPVHIRQPDDQIVVEITNDQLDRHGTKIEADGARLEEYKENPVVLWRHGHGMEGVPIGKTTNIQVRGGSIFATVEFDQTDEFAQKIEGKVRSEFINAASIGFIPHTINREDDDPVIAEWTLLEWSFVGVPSNPGALVSEREMEVFGPVIEQVAERKLEAMLSERGAAEHDEEQGEGQREADTGEEPEQDADTESREADGDEDSEAPDGEGREEDDTKLSATVQVKGDDLITQIEELRTEIQDLKKSSDSERSAPDRDDTVADSSTDADEREAADQAAERSSEEVDDEAASEDRPKLVRLKLSDMQAMAREAHRRRERRADRMADDIFKRITGKA